MAQGAEERVSSFRLPSREGLGVGYNSIKYKVQNLLIHSVILMIKIGITGQSGFIGTHLYNYLGLKKDEVTRIPFQDEIFSDQTQIGGICKAMRRNHPPCRP